MKIVAGCDVGSLTSKAVIMKDGKIIGSSIIKSKPRPKDSADAALEAALKNSGILKDDIAYIIGTGYGRDKIGFVDEVVSEITCHGIGARWLLPTVETVIDIGGMDNKAISVQDGIPGTFTMGGICAGASGRFLEMTAKRLGVDITELGPLALRGMGREVPMNSYCIVFGTQSLVNALAAGSSPEDVAAAACHSVAEQVFEQQLQEVDIKEPVIMVGGTSLIQGLVKAMGDLLQVEVVVPHHSQYIGAVGSALLASGFIKGS